jgi:hypothetical protein
VNDDAPGTAGRLGLVLYLLGCIVAAGFVLFGAVLLATHAGELRDCELARAEFRPVARRYIDVMKAVLHARENQDPEDEAKSKELYVEIRPLYDVAQENLEKACPWGAEAESDRPPYPWELAGLALSAAVASWLAGCGLRFILKGN